jgi:type II secretory pathway component GspD/PulD (secretin)
MTFRLTIPLIALLMLLGGCAARKDAVKPAPTEEEAPAAEEAFSLPPTDEETVAGEQEAAKPDMSAILTEKEKDEEYLILNFENTDIKTIISTFAELLEFNYILSPGVGGSVTIQSHKRVPTKDLFQIFQSILEVNGLTAVRVGAYYHIITIEMARTYPLDIEKGKKLEHILDSSFVTQLIPLQYVNAGEIANNILRQLMPRGVHLIVYEPSNTLILTARPETLEKFMRLLEAIDIPEGESNTVRTFVYYVENGNAAKLQGILKEVYLGKTTAKKTPNARPKPGIRVAPRTAAPAVEGSLPGEIGDVTITAYEDINALIIKTTPRSYLALLEVLKKIDVPPKQVLIDVMIAEIELKDELQFGLEWFLKSKSGNIAGMNFGGLGGTGTTPIVQPPSVPSPTSSGFSFAASGTMSGDNFNALFNMLEIYSSLNILASPNILAMDNKEAEIKIGSEVPTATRKTSSGTTGTDVDIQYKTVGTLLAVTPHITEKGRVSMKIAVESSTVGAITLVAGDEYTSFNTRNASTTAVVDNEKTLMLGGIIYNRKANAKSGIPFLSRIPLIGALFGSQTYASEKSELLIMVTPHVISNTEEADTLTREYQKRVKIIKKNLGIKERDIPVEVKIKDPEEAQEGAEEPGATEETKEAGTPTETEPGPEKE